MAKIQFLGGSYTAPIPPHIIKHLDVKKGDVIEHQINKKTGVVEIKVISKKGE